MKKKNGKEELTMKKNKNEENFPRLKHKNAL